MAPVVRTSKQKAASPFLSGYQPSAVQREQRGQTHVRDDRLERADVASHRNYLGSKSRPCVELKPVSDIFP